MFIKDNRTQHHRYRVRRNEEGYVLPGCERYNVLRHKLVVVSSHWGPPQAQWYDVDTTRKASRHGTVAHLVSFTAHAPTKDKCGEHFGRLLKTGFDRIDAIEGITPAEALKLRCALHDILKRHWEGL